ncbi:MAG TPA: response regulator transcription factor [Actinoplanes sp.]|nr:response regulator transcription factor [Actinoplanes sp.]
MRGRAGDQARRHPLRCRLGSPHRDAQQRQADGDRSQEQDDADPAGGLGPEGVIQGLDDAEVQVLLGGDPAEVVAGRQSGEPDQKSAGLGYVLKGAAPDDMIRAIASVAAGEAIFGTGVARRAVAYLTAPRPETTAFPELTAREREVLGLIAAGLANAAIARRLGLAPNTVSNHISNIFAKLRVASRAEAIVRARSAGLG